MLAFLMALMGGLGFTAAAAGGGGDDKPAAAPKANKPHIVAKPEQSRTDDMAHGHDMTPGGEDENMAHDGDMTSGGDDHMAHDGDTTPVVDDSTAREDDMTSGGDDHMTHNDDTTPVVDDSTAREDHADHGSDEAMAHDDHAGHSGSESDVVLPQTEAEIDAFVAAVRSAPEVHSHHDGSSKAGEHMAAMDLVPRDEATHIAVANGDWDDPMSWHNGEVPGNDAKVLIPEGVHVTYDHVSDARLFTLRVDGKLEFATDVSSQMVVDTIVISPVGALQIGTGTDPVDPNVNVDIIFANNGAIDTGWDPLLLSRGMIAHGEVEIHGAAKASHAKVVDDPMAGDTWVNFAGAPEGWAVGDTIIVAGTDYRGYDSSLPGGYQPPEDEERVITDIQGSRIFFDEPLVFDHDTPREDLKTSVANYTRNISFETENAATAEVFERGHVMFMHNDEVDVRYAEFHELGRTDKSEPARNTHEFDSIEFDSNVKGRYSFHFHRAGVGGEDEPGMAVGNAVYGSPGWGFVHHDSHAVFENNATYDTYGAGYVAESGNETGTWHNNIAIFAQGDNWWSSKQGNDVANFDMGKTGDGFWFQGRMVESTDNIAASVNHGFVYLHRGPRGEDGNLKFDSAVSDIEEVFYHWPTVSSSAHPILSFDGNEAFAARTGLSVIKANPHQGHDVHTVMEDFTAWNVVNGAGFEYTAHYTIRDFDITGREATDVTDGGGFGIGFFNATSDMTIVDSNVENVEQGISLFKLFTGSNPSPEELHDYSVINPTFKNVMTELANYDPALDTVISTQDLPNLAPGIELDGPLVFKEGDGNIDPAFGKIIITGTKSDTLGETPFPGGDDYYVLNRYATTLAMEESGYYTTESGQNYFLLDLYFSDRVTGDIYSETHPVLMDPNVAVGTGRGQYSDVPFNGIRELDSPDNPTFDAAELWATITDGQLIREDEDIPDLEYEEAMLAAE